MEIRELLLTAAGNGSRSFFYAQWFFAGENCLLGGSGLPRWQIGRFYLRVWRVWGWGQSFYKAMFFKGLRLFAVLFISCGT